MFFRRFLAFLTAAAATVCLTINAYASVKHTAVGEKEIDVFISGLVNTDDLDIMVSNRAAKVFDSGVLKDNGIIRTTLLIDVSTSIPWNRREDVVNLVKTFIENIEKNEELRLITFGEEINVLQSFTHDRYDLMKGAEKIIFNGQASAIYDTVDFIINEKRAESDKPCYYRAVVISDGAELNEGGITKEELYLEMNSTSYPFDVISVSGAHGSSAEKDMLSLARVSNGIPVYFDDKMECSDVLDMLNVSDLKWIRVEIPDGLADGSVRSVSISDKTGAAIIVDVRMPVLASVSEPVSSAPAQEESAPVSEASEPISEVSEPAESNENEGELLEFLAENKTVIIIAACGIVALGIILAVIIAVASRGKKKKNSVQHGTDRINDRTEIIDGNNSSDIQPKVKSETICIEVVNSADASQTWRVPIVGQVIIGRDENCGIVLSESSVARQQCKIFIGSSGAPMLENLSSSNITKLNNNKISFAQPLKPNDKITCGRVVLIVKAFYFQNNNTTKRINDKTEFINV